MTHNRLRANVTANMAGGLVLLVGQLATIPLALQSATVSEYGVWLAVVALANLMGLTDLGLSASLIRFAAPSVSAGEAAPVVTYARRTHARLAFVVALVQTAGAALIISATSDSLGPTERLTLIALSAFVASISLYARHWQAYNQCLSRFGRERLHQVIGLCVRIAGLLGCMALGGGITHVAAVEAVSLVVPGSISTVRHLVSGTYPLRSDPISRESRRAVLSFALSWFVIAGATNFAVAVPTMVASVAASPALATAVGAGVRITNAYRQVLVWSLEPTFPHSVSLTEAERDRLVVRATALVWSVGVASTAAFALLGPELLSLWLGRADPDLASRAFPFCLALMIATVVTFVPNCFSVIRQAQHRPDVFRWETIAWAVSTPIAFWIALVSAPDTAPAALVVAAALSFAPAYVRIVKALRPPTRGRFIRLCGGAVAAATVSAAIGALVGRALDLPSATPGGAAVRIAVLAGLMTLAVGVVRIGSEIASRKRRSP